MNLFDAVELDLASLEVEGATVDPWTDAEPDASGALVLHRESGQTDAAVITRVGRGMRLRIGGPRQTGILEDLHEERVELRRADDAVLAEAGDVSARWSGGELVIGPLSRTSGDGSMGGPGLRPGALVRDSRVVGWVDRFALGPRTAVFGGGESVQGPALRGRRRTMRNVETSGLTGYDLGYLNVPFLWSPDGWGIFVHTGAPVMADVGATVSGALTLRVDDPVLDLFVFVGDPIDVLRQYHGVTGRPGDLPEWAMGVWLSRCSYFSERELHDLLDEAADAGCPVDVLHVDAWQSGEALVDLACSWAPDDERFPPGWVGRLRERGVRVSLWHNPYVPEHSVAAEEGRRLGLFASAPDGTPAQTPDIPGRLVLDFTNPRTLDWWREQIGAVLATGASSLKADFGEEVPEDATFADGSTGLQLRNSYAHLYQRASHAALAQARPEDGPAAMFVRSGTAGSQRTPCHWVGDSASTWDGMTTALRSALSLSLSGFAWVSHDVGGFWVAGNDAHMKASADGDPSHFRADVDPELFVRWTQWGALSPVMRFHGTGRREPFAYPEPFGEIAVTATRVRSALRPYLARCREETRRSCLPVMRPMPLVRPEHPEAADALQYFLGPELLVCPVLEPGGRTRVWLPPGRWRQLLGDRELDGGWHDLVLGLDEWPAFVPSPVPSWIEEVDQMYRRHPIGAPMSQEME